jgi:hypothetical protein
LTDSYTAGNLKGMFNLSFDITPPALLGLIITGGLFLTGFQYWLTKVSIVKTLKLNK